MNYVNHYQRLMERARGRKLSGYKERHHVKPRCLGGDDSKSNIVNLRAEEHYVAHQLLVKMYPKNHKLIWSAVNMASGSRRQGRANNKLYGWLRRQWSASMRKWSTGRIASEEARARMSAARLGKKMKPHSEETKKKMSAASLGRPKSAEHRAASAAAHLGMKYDQPRSAESRARSSAAVKAAFATGAHRFDQSDPAHRAKQAEKTREVWARRRTGELPPRNPKSKSRPRSAEARHKQSEVMREMWVRRRSGALPMPVYL